MAMQQHDASQAPPTAVSRRRFLLLIGAGLNAIAVALLAAPVLGYVFASFGRKGPSQAWISLGPIDTYPESQTRLATYRNPFTRPWTVRRPTSHAGCGGSLGSSFRSLR